MRLPLALGLALIVVGGDHALAGINVMDHPDVLQVISVRNNTPRPVTFVRTANTCVYDSPDSFTVPANSTATINAKNKWWDTGLDNCYAKHHLIAYQDGAGAGNTFAVQESNTGNNQRGCLDIKYNVIIWIHQAVCPVATGSVFAPVNDDDNPSGILCPPGADNCPPRDDGFQTQWFGFAIEEPQDFSVVIDNDDSRPLDCLLTDLNRKTDRNGCTQSEVTVGPSKTLITLPGLCGSSYYRFADRVNVQLLCYLANTVYQGTKSWPAAKNGATYVYNLSARP